MSPFTTFLDAMPAARTVTNVRVASAVAITSGSDLHPLSENCNAMPTWAPGLNLPAALRKDIRSCWIR
eukprot:7588471-Pyramimonas_sp.AAC.1